MNTTRMSTHDRTDRMPTIGTALRLLFASLALVTVMATAATASAHPHTAENAKGGEGQIVANGQNHPGFVDQGDGTGMSCEGENMPDNAGPAGYGLETAHHGPDQGDPGKDDGCYVTTYPTQDGSPGLD